MDALRDMRALTGPQRDWILERYVDTPNADLAEAFQAEFGVSVTPRQLASWGVRRGLTKTAEARSAGLRRYTDEQASWLRDNIPGRTTAEVIDAYAKRFGETLTVPMVAGMRKQLGVRSGVNGGWFRPGVVSRNRGRSWDDIMPAEAQERCRATQFRPGETTGIAASVELPLLTVRESREGYKTIKVAPRDARSSAQYWIPLAVFEWERANGRPWPEGHRVAYANHDVRDCSPGNVVPVPADLDLIIKSRRGLPYHDRESLEVALTHARIVRRRAELAKAPRRCAACGREFDPEFANQRRCRGCIDAGRRG